MTSPRRLILKSILFACALLVAPAVHAADPAAAVAQVEAMYAAHAKAFAGKGPSVFLGGEEGEKWFSKPVAEKMGSAELGFDPIYDGQDAEITDLNIRLDPVLKVLAGTAHVKVTFKNFGEAAELTYLLRQEAGGWRITDIQYGSGSSLSQMLDEQG